jgi:hypothetical protein
LIGGLFRKVDDVAMPYLARLHGDRPRLSIERSEANVIVSWPAGWTGFSLQETADVTSTWSNVQEAPENDGASFRVTVSGGDGAKLFQAMKP